MDNEATTSTSNERGRSTVQSNSSAYIPEDPDFLLLQLPQHLNYFLRLSTSFEARYRDHRASEDLDGAIKYLRIWMEHGGPHMIADSSVHFGILLRTRFDKRGERSDLDEAITNFRQAVELGFYGTCDYLPLLNDLADLLKSRYDLYAEDEDLQQAHIGLPSGLNSLANLLQSRYVRYGVDADLEDAIKTFRRAFGLTQMGHRDLPVLINNLANSLGSRYVRYGEDSDLEDAIARYREAIQLSPDGDSHLPSWLNNLALSLKSRFARYGEEVDLEQAITNHRRAVKLTPVDHQDLPSLLNHLAISLDSRFSRYGEDANLEEAIAKFREAIKLTPVDHSHFPGYLSNLASSVASRFNRYGDEADLEESITNSRCAVELTPAGHSALPSRLHNLALSFQSRYVRYGEDTDLEEAIAISRQAIKLTPVGNEKLPSRLGNLAVSLASRYSRYGADADLEESITNHRQALELTPDGHRDLPVLLNNLAMSLGSRHVRYGEDLDLAEAITHYRQAIKVTPIGHKNLPSWLTTLADSLVTRFHRYGEDVDLEEAITNYRRAIELLPAGDSDLPIRLNNLAISLTVRFAVYGADGDLEGAITLFRHAIELTPDDHTFLPSWLDDLASALHSRFTRYEEDANLEESITNHRRAIELTHIDHSNYSSRLGNLASSLESRYRRHRDDADLNAAITHYANGSEVSTGVTFFRFQCAVRGAALAHSSGHPTEALEAYSHASLLLPKLIWFGQSVASRQRRLALKPTNLASDAAACAISLGNLEKAVELLDHGRSIFWSQAMDIPTDLIDLKNSDASLADEFENVARALAAGTFQDVQSDALGPGIIVDTLEQRRRLADRLDLLLLRIRELPGFQNFMQPLPFSQLRRAAAGGPVIILNVSSYRCDALIVTVDHPPQLVPLPDMSLDHVRELAANFHKRQPREDQDPSAFRTCLKIALQEIWRIAVSPVLNALDALGYTDLQSKSRIWWCPTGPLSFLPIHAAGPYTKSGRPSLLDRAISSYTSTLSALLRARSQRRSTESCRILLIGQTETPDQKPLSSATEELDVICESAHSNGVVDVTRLEGPHALHDTILEKLDDTTCVHFACHGHQDQSRNGLISALYVHDERLLLPTLASRHLSRADFAFLSACHTASGSQDMPDEAMHIAAGMQVAGFRSIVATMWAMGDHMGPRVAEQVYGRLLGNGPEGFDSTKAAASLNEGVCALRKAKDDSGRRMYEINQWVPFIHIGI